MLEKVIKKDPNGEKVLSLYTSYTSMNYDEEDKYYISFHDSKSVSALLSAEELTKLIDILTECREILKERNKAKKEERTRAEDILNAISKVINVDK